MVEALIFDMDGVLANTIELHYRAWKHIADDAGVPFDRSAMDNLRGLQRRESLERLLGARYDDSRYEAYSDLKDHYYEEALEQSPLEELRMPGVLELIAEARRAGLKLGVASASTQAIPTLKRIGLYDTMDAVADGLTVVNSKPAPDIFLWVAGALRVKPAQVVVFEDAAAGVQAARTAGMFVVGIGPAALVGAAHRVYPALAAVRLSDILDLQQI